MRGGLSRKSHFESSGHAKFCATTHEARFVTRIARQSSQTKALLRQPRQKRSCAATNTRFRPAFHQGLALSSNHGHPLVFTGYSFGVRGHSAVFFGWTWNSAGIGLRSSSSVSATSSTDDRTCPPLHASHDALRRSPALPRPPPPPRKAHALFHREPSHHAAHESLPRPPSHFRPPPPRPLIAHALFHDGRSCHAAGPLAPQGTTTPPCSLSAHPCLRPDCSLSPGTSASRAAFPRLIFAVAPAVGMSVPSPSRAAVARRQHPPLGNVDWLPAGDAHICAAEPATHSHLATTGGFAVCLASAEHAPHVGVPRQSVAGGLRLRDAVRGYVCSHRWYLGGTTAATAYQAADNSPSALGFPVATAGIGSCRGLAMAGAATTFCGAAAADTIAVVVAPLPLAMSGHGGRGSCHGLRWRWWWRAHTGGWRGSVPDGPSLCL